MNTITKSIIVVFSFVSLLLGIVGSALADGEAYIPCDGNTRPKVKMAFEKSKSLESKGDFINAFKVISSAYYCNSDPTLMKEIGAEEERLGIKAAAQMEKSNSADACALYERFNSNINNHKYARDVDRALLKYAETVPFDKPGNFMVCQPSDDINVQKKLGKIASRNADKVLAQEAVAFNKKPESDINLSRKYLAMANEWYTIYAIKNPIGRAHLVRLTQSHGDTFAEKSDTSSLDTAINYYDLSYSFADDDLKSSDEKKALVRKKAAKLGDEFMKKNEYERASDYYGIALAFEKREDALRLRDERDKQKELAADKRAKEREKAETTRQEQFKKDQKSLEKELGL